MSAPEFDGREYVQPAATPVPTFPDQSIGQRIDPGLDPRFPAMPSRGYPEQPFAPPYDQQSSAGAGTLIKALLFGAAAALVGSLGWGLFSLTGIMVSIVAIGIGYLVARTMMTASGGVGGRGYQIGAAVLTYFGCSLGDVWGIVIHSARDGVDVMHNLSGVLVVAAVYGTAGPFLALKESPINAGLGLLILFFGIRTAWRIAAGSPGFGGGQGSPRVGPFGMR